MKIKIVVAVIGDSGDICAEHQHYLWKKCSLLEVIIENYHIHSYFKQKSKQFRNFLDHSTVCMYSTYT